MTAQNARDLAFGRRGGGWSDAEVVSIVRSCEACGRPMLGGQLKRHGVCSPRLGCCGAYTDLVRDLDKHAADHVEMDAKVTR